MRIAFYASQAGKIWTGDALEAGPLGGSETAVIYVARGLARLGHECFVFTRGKPGLYDDVVYLDFDRARNLLRTLPLDVLVCSRDAIPLLWPHRAGLTALWHHDLPQGRSPDAQLDFFVSAWQANVYVGNGFSPKERARVLYNGVDNALLAGRAATVREFRSGVDTAPADAPRLAWTSNPERGLWYAGEALQQIRKNYPRAELHVWGRNEIYGWSSTHEGNYLPSSMDGVVMHPSLPKRELAAELATMDLWLYPTWWPETYCIAAVEAQAAGVPVVASAFGALQETARAGILVPGRAGEEGHVETMAQEACALLADPDRRARMQAAGLAYAADQDWSKHVIAWNDLLQGALHLQAA